MFIRHRSDRAKSGRDVGRNSPRHRRAIAAGLSIPERRPRAHNARRPFVRDARVQGGGAGADLGSRRGRRKTRGRRGNVRRVEGEYRGANIPQRGAKPLGRGRTPGVVNRRTAAIGRGPREIGGATQARRPARDHRPVGRGRRPRAQRAARKYFGVRTARHKGARLDGTDGAGRRENSGGGFARPRNSQKAHVFRPADAH